MTNRIDDFPKSGKIKVTPEESVIVQRRLFAEGYKSNHAGGKLSNIDCDYIFWFDNRIEWADEVCFFVEDPAPEYTMDLFEPKQSDGDEVIFTDDFLKEIGFERVPTSGEPQYGKAIEIKTNGMTVLKWNTQGHSCTYFGDKLESNVAFGIRKDGDTRDAFNGYVFNREQVKLLLSLTL